VFRKNENEETEILLNSKTDNSATRDQWPSIKGPLFSNCIHQLFNREKISNDLKAQFEVELVATLMIDDAETKMRTETALLFELKTSVPFYHTLQICGLIYVDIYLATGP
jgi:hypothetical protein